MIASPDQEVAPKARSLNCLLLEIDLEILIVQVVGRSAKANNTTINDDDDDDDDNNMGRIDRAATRWRLGGGKFKQIAAAL